METVREMSYRQYKCLVKNGIVNRVKKDLVVEKDTKRKLRWINPGKRQDYLNDCSIQEASLIMKIRLHMISAMGNYGGGKCRRCQVEEETTEHILECQTNGTMKFDETKMEDVSWLRTILKTYKRFEEQYPRE